MQEEESHFSPFEISPFFKPPSFSLNPKQVSLSKLNTGAASNKQHKFGQKHPMSAVTNIKYKYQISLQISQTQYQPGLGKGCPNKIRQNPDIALVGFA